MADNSHKKCTVEEIIHLATIMKWGEVEIHSKPWNEFLSELCIVRENKGDLKELSKEVENCAKKAMESNNYDIALMLMAQHIDDFYCISGHHGDVATGNYSSIIEDQRSYAEETVKQFKLLQDKLKHADCVFVWVYCYAAMAYVYEIQNSDAQLKCETYLNEAKDMVVRNSNNNTTCSILFIHERAVLNNCMGRYHREMSNSALGVSNEEAGRAIDCFDSAIRDFQGLHTILKERYGQDHDHFYREAGLTRMQKIQFLLKSTRTSSASLVSTGLTTNTTITIETELKTIRSHFSKKSRCLSYRLEGLIESAEAEWHLKLIQNPDVQRKSALAIVGLGHAEKAREIYKGTNFKEKQWVEDLIKELVANIKLREVYTPDAPMKHPTEPLQNMDRLQKNLRMFLESEPTSDRKDSIQRVYVDLCDADPFLVIDVSAGQMCSARDNVNEFMKNYSEFTRYARSIEFIEQNTVPVACNVRCGDEVKFLLDNIEIRQTVGGFPKAIGSDVTYCLTTAHGLVPEDSTPYEDTRAGLLGGMNFQEVFYGIVGNISEHPVDAGIPPLDIDIGVFPLPREVDVQWREKFMYKSMFTGNVFDLSQSNVRKRGAVTGDTEGVIAAVDADIILIDPTDAASIFAVAGDSGSIIYSEESDGGRQAIGLVTQIQRVKTRKHPNGIQRTYAVLLRNCFIGLQDLFDITVQIAPTNLTPSVEELDI